MLVSLEWRLIIYNLKSICSKSSTLAKCQLQNTIMIWCEEKRKGILTYIHFHSGKMSWGKNKGVMWIVCLLLRKIVTLFCTVLLFSLHYTGK